MKNKTIYTLILMIFFFISLTGFEVLDKNFGILNLKTERPVENNLFSSSFPEIKLQMNRELKYLGSVQIAEKINTGLNANFDPREQSFDADAYLFVQTDPQKRITRGVLIRMLVAHGDPSQDVPEIFTKTSKNILESGEMNILKDTYQYDLYPEQELFVPQERALLRNSRVPPCLLVKRLSIKAGLGHKSRVHLIYFEDASTACGSRPCGTCLASKNRSAEQKQFLREFTDRSFASIRFLETKTVEDTTSRYVDGVPKAQPAPAGMAPVYEPSKADTVEKRLEALKRIYEKNLISREEYEKKKTEILNEL